MLLPNPANPENGPRSRKCQTGLWILLLFSFACFVLVPVFFDYFANETRYPDLDGTLVSVGCDFNGRYNEFHCIREGTDPYLIRTGEARSDVYEHYLAPPSHPPKRKIDAYTPWSYSFFLWLSFFSERTAWSVFYALMVLSLCVLPAFAFLSVAPVATVREAVLCALGALFLGFPVTFCLYAGNYCLFIAAALCLMVWAMQTGHKVLAAVAWAVMMVKPQTAVLFSIPLLCHREFRVCALAAAICLGAAVLPAVLCRQSVLAMVFEILKFGSTVANQTKLLPSAVMEMLSPFIPLSAANLLNAVAGGLVCIWLTLRLKNSPSWLIRMLPAMVLSSYWTYCLPYNDCLLAVPQFFFLYVVLKPFPKSLKLHAAICFATIPFLHIQRVFSMENDPWTLFRVLGFSLPETSFSFHLLSGVHLVAAYLLFFAFLLFCLHLSNRVNKGEAVEETWTVPHQHRQG